MSPSQNASQKSEVSNVEAPIQDSSQKPEDQSQSQSQVQTQGQTETSQADQSQDHLDQTVLSQGSSKSTQESKDSDDESAVSSKKSTGPAQTASQPAASQSRFNLGGVLISFPNGVSVTIIGLNCEVESTAAGSRVQVINQPEASQRRASQ